MATTTRQVAGIAVLVALIAGLLGYWLGTLGDAPTANRVEFTDKAGRHCTQVGATSPDCDYPPAENRLGNALDGLVNP